jgi:hypothetical protein
MVDWLYKTLQTRGLTVFVAKHVRQPGNDVALKVKQAIDSANVVLAFLSKGGASLGLFPVVEAARELCRGSRPRWWRSTRLPMARAARSGSGRSNLKRFRAAGS